MKFFTYAAILVLLLFVTPQAISAQPAGQPIPVIKTVSPTTAWVGQVVTGRGDSLNTRLVDVYLTDGKKDFRLTIVNKSEKTVEFRIPATVPNGRFRLMISTPDSPPVLVEQPAVLDIVTIPSVSFPILDAVVDVLSSVAPGIKKLISHRQVLSPVDLERDYGLTGGHPLHAEAALDQFFVWRPLLGHARYRLGIDRLYLCGSGAHPGGGITGGPGQNAAREILADLRKK